MKTKRQRKQKEVRRASASKRAEKQRGGVRPYLNLPKNVKLFDFEKEGTKKVDVVEYVVGKHNPNADKGERYFELTFFIHKGLGPDNEWHLCPKKTFGKPCPVCQHRTKMGRNPDADEDEVDALKWNERQLFAIVDPKKKKDGVQVMDKSFHLFGKELDAAIRKYKKKHGEDAADKFASPDDGLSVLCEVEEKTFKKGTFTNVKSAKLVERAEQYDEDLIEEVPCLDKLLVETPYEELKQLFDQSGDDDDDEDDDDTDTDDDDDDSESDEDDDDGEEDDDDDDDTDDDSDDEDEEDDSDDDDDDDEEEDEVEVKKGDTVSFTYKGKKRTGVVKRVKDGMAHVKVEGRSDAYAVDPDDCTVVDNEEEDDDEAYDEDDDDSELEEEDTKARKRMNKKKKRK
jgi:hypothetical protein